MKATLAESSFNHYAPLGLIILMAIVFGIGTLVATHLFGPSKQGNAKSTIYESGMNPIGSAHRRFQVRFWIIAMTFLLFDVEIVFLYPWASTFPKLANMHQGEDLSLMFMMRGMFFVATSILAFVYAWRKGIFRYE